MHSKHMEEADHCIPQPAVRARPGSQCRGPGGERISSFTEASQAALNLALARASDISSSKGHISCSSVFSQVTYFFSPTSTVKVPPPTHPKILFRGKAQELHSVVIFRDFL